MKEKHEKLGICRTIVLNRRKAARKSILHLGSFGMNRRIP